MTKHANGDCGQRTTPTTDLHCVVSKPLLLLPEEVAHLAADERCPQCQHLEVFHLTDFMGRVCFLDECGCER